LYTLQAYGNYALLETQQLAFEYGNREPNDFVVHQVSVKSDTNNDIHMIIIPKNPASDALRDFFVNGGIPMPINSAWTTANSSHAP